MWDSLSVRARARVMSWLKPLWEHPAWVDMVDLRMRVLMDRTNAICHAAWKHDARIFTLLPNMTMGELLELIPNLDPHELHTVRFGAHLLHRLRRLQMTDAEWDHLWWVCIEDRAVFASMMVRFGEIPRHDDTRQLVINILIEEQDVLGFAMMLPHMRKCLPGLASPLTVAVEHGRVGCAMMLCAVGPTVYGEAPIRGLKTRKFAGIMALAIRVTLGPALKIPVNIDHAWEWDEDMWMLLRCRYPALPSRETVFLQK